MARGDMKVTNTTFGVGYEILNRPPYKAVPMTIDFASVAATDDDGRKVARAGIPIDKDGNPVMTTPFTDAVGILLYDVYEDNPDGAILTEAYVHTTRAQENSNVTYDGTLVAAMVNAGNRIRFENPHVVGTIS